MYFYLNTDHDGVARYHVILDAEPPLVDVIPRRFAPPTYRLSEEFRDWLYEHLGPLDLYRYVWYPRELRIKFRYDEDASLFKLTWM